MKMCFHFCQRANKTVLHINHPQACASMLNAPEKEMHRLQDNLFQLHSLKMCLHFGNNQSPRACMTRTASIIKPTISDV